MIACFAIAMALLASPPRSAAGELDAYRRFVTKPEARTLLEIARNAMEGREWDRTESIAWPGAPAGMYVSLTRGRETRACVGGPTPLRGTLAESVSALATEVLSADRRRAPVRSEELDDLRIVISFVNAGELVASPYLIDPGREGLSVVTERGSIAFLPGEARTVHWALDQARRAGVLAAGLEPSYRRLEVVTLTERARPPAPWRNPDVSP